jgi:hypothetical protein
MPTLRAPLRPFPDETQRMVLSGGLPWSQSTRPLPLPANTLGARHRRRALAIGNAGRQTFWALSTRWPGANDRGLFAVASPWVTHNGI